MEGTAFDVAMSNHDTAAFEAVARDTGVLGFGFYPRSDFMHIDLGPKREWGQRFAAPAFGGTPPARNHLIESRAIKGGGTTGVATLQGCRVGPYLNSLR